VLVPGLTYGASYWNFPVDPARYSYVRAATAAGYATLAIDRLGTGASDHPPAAQVTAMSEAFARHDVVDRLTYVDASTLPASAAQRPETPHLTLCIPPRGERGDQIICLPGKSMTYLSRSSRNSNHTRGSNAAVAQW
jgi:hypothetical protein